MKKVGELKKHIHLCNSYEEHMLNELEALNIRRKLNLVTKKQYKKQLSSLLRGRSVDDWLNYYTEYKGTCYNIIKEQKTDNMFRNVLLVLLLLILILPVGLKYTGYGTFESGVYINKIVSSNSYLLVDGVAQPIPQELEFYNGEYVYKLGYLHFPEAIKIEIVDNNQVVFLKQLK